LDSLKKIVGKKIAGAPYCVKKLGAHICAISQPKPDVSDFGRSIV
jgi:hypothetical protein